VTRAVRPAIERESFVRRDIGPPGIRVFALPEGREVYHRFSPLPPDVSSERRWIFGQSSGG